ncbi:MAG: hypothetical protein SGI72_01150 [Planctomycetota bacterium]|nr:hypothetical protein [Planctomycetota bacterium]
MKQQSYSIRTGTALVFVAGTIALGAGGLRRNGVPTLAGALPPCATSLLCPWPAEPPGSSTNLTAIEGAGTNDFHEDLSGACWNPYGPALWVCRNGGTGGSKVWKLVPNGANSFQVGTVTGQRAEWTNFGDSEALALASFTEPNTIYTVDEATNSIQEWDLSAPTQVLRHTWNLTAHVPAYQNGEGIEGLAFVPDIALEQGHFIGANGQPRRSRFGLGALAFVGHQNGGHIYVFDLNRSNGAFQFVGKYATSDPEVAELTFDPSQNVLYAWHGDGRNDLEGLALGSTSFGSIRKLTRLLTYDYPTTTNAEGFALQWSPSGCKGDRGAFVLTDDGGTTALRWFRTFPCGF